MNSDAVRHDVSLFTSDDLYLFNEGNHFRLYEKLGAHVRVVDGVAGTNFAVWAPGADYVSVIGDFNAWDPGTHPLTWRYSSGIWEGFIPGLVENMIYKYHVAAPGGFKAEKSDPFAFQAECPPKTASVIRKMDHEWKDQSWMAKRHESNGINAPISVYEMHLGSWRRSPDDPYVSMSYRDMASSLVAHLSKMGFTHVEFMPVMEHPFYGSWGYQTLGYFAPTSRYGTAEDFMYLIDQLHQAGIGVILDWVPSHFPVDGHGLAQFDGTHLFEHADPKEGFHPDWKSAIFNYGRNEVRSFLISSAVFWCDYYHIDGIRVDAVASMLYRDYSRKEGEWVPNQYGGRENFEAIFFMKRMNEVVYGLFPDTQMYAEESTAWPMVSKPTYLGGLGFGMKWDMGWMHDTLKYFQLDAIFRKYHHNQLTFRMIYAFTEQFIMPLSHDEVVHGKGSLLSRMPGDDWQRFANLRLLYGYMYAQPGKKLLFMGCEFAQPNEWKHDHSLDWHLTQYAPHEGMMKWVADLNHLYRNEPTLHERDFSSEGFRWIVGDDSANSVLVFLRLGEWGRPVFLIACNFTPVPRYDYRIGVPGFGFWEEVLNSDSANYGGSGQGNMGGVRTQPIGWHGYNDSVTIQIPPLGIVFLKHAM